MSPLTHVYLAFSQVSGPVWRYLHRKRLKKGKELADRLPEKYGVASLPRAEGEVLWFHALSVGESLALVPLIQKALVEKPKASVVLTTSTVTSIAALEKAGLPERVVHTMLPIDTAQAVRRFLDHWRPSIAIFAELDFWPRLIVETKRRDIPLVLVNSRMSEKSLRSRSRLRGMMRDILMSFDRLLLQDDESLRRFVQLGAPGNRLEVVGTLKAAARPLPADPFMLAELNSLLGDRPVWCAAATHPAEEDRIVEAHELVRRTHPNCLLIIAPRYMDSADDIETNMQKSFAHVSRRSRGELPASATDVYLADTIGEMGLWYRLSSVSFVGHSLMSSEVAGGGGKNPYEAMALGSVVVHGPYVSDFSETYEALGEAGAARLVESVEALAETVSDLLLLEARQPVLAAAEQVIHARRGVLDATWGGIEQVLER